MTDELKCLRCKEPFGGGHRCQECGVARDRVVRRKKGRIGGKRGRNSGKVSSGNKRKGA